LAIDDTDLLGLKIKDIATLIRNEDVRDLNFLVWRYTHQEEEQNDTGLALKGPLPNVARNLANALSGTVRMHSSILKPWNHYFILFYFDSVYSTKKDR